MTKVTSVTTATGFRKAFSAMQAPAAYPTLNLLTVDPLVAKTAGIGLIVGEISAEAPGNFLQLLFSGIAAENAAVNVKIKAFKEVERKQWVPAATLLDAVVTFGAKAGAAGLPILNTERLAKTITVNSLKIAPGNRVWVADDEIAMIEIDPAGAQRILCYIGEVSSGSVTSANVLYSWLG